MNTWDEGIPLVCIIIVIIILTMSDFFSVIRTRKKRPLLWMPFLFSEASGSSPAFGSGPWGGSSQQQQQNQEVKAGISFTEMHIGPSSRNGRCITSSMKPGGKPKYL